MRGLFSIMTGKHLVTPVSRDRIAGEKEDDSSYYLESAYENFSSITPYVIEIDRANHPKDTVGLGIILRPETLFSRLDDEIMRIPGTISTGPDRRELYNLLDKQEKTIQNKKYADAVTSSYFLRRYPGGVDVWMEKGEFLPDGNYPKGLSCIRIMANYAGNSGAKIRELEDIANKHGLKEWKSKNNL